MRLTAAFRDNTDNACDPESDPAEALASTKLEGLTPRPTQRRSAVVKDLIILNPKILIPVSLSERSQNASGDPKNREVTVARPLGGHNLGIRTSWRFGPLNEGRCSTDYVRVI
jgi:hypothetical protein